MVVLIKNHEYKNYIFLLSILFLMATNAMSTAIPIKNQSIISKFSIFELPYTYTIVNNPPTMSMAEVRETINEAFKTWSIIAFGLRKIYKELPPANCTDEKFCDIIFHFNNESHIFVSSPFNKAYAKSDTYTTESNNIYFKNGLQWKRYKVGEKIDNKKTDLYSIALYIVGTAIPKDVSDNDTSVMYRWYKNPADNNGKYVKPVLGEYDLEKSYSSTWTTSTTQYTILNNPPTLSMTDVKETMAKAFNTWTLLYPHRKFVEVPLADCYDKIRCYYNVSFYSGKHSDIFYGSNFNEKQAGHGLDDILIHFNYDTQWKRYKVGEKVDNKSTDFYSVALYTIGQFLRWESNQNVTSIMFEGYQSSDDENGNYIEPTFSEYDLIYLDNEILIAQQRYCTEEELQAIYNAAMKDEPMPSCTVKYSWGKGDEV